MPLKTRRPRPEDTEWFDGFPPIDPPGWDDKDSTRWPSGWCRRHWAPLAAVRDPAVRGRAQELASLDLMVTWAGALRTRIAPLPVPARHLAALVRELSPVCCQLRDGDIRAIITAALDSAGV
jgi:hypothetical protein